MEHRDTFRRGCCLQLLQNGPMLFCELKWRTWMAEWKARRTKFVCSKSAHYNRSFKRSIHLWQSRGDLTTHVLKTRITYGLAARLAVFTVLERGQLSSPEPARGIRLYFDDIWCSVVVCLGDGIAVNLGAVRVGQVCRYAIISGGVQVCAEIEKRLAAVDWQLFLSSSGTRVDPFALLPDESSHDAEVESFAPEGVALSLRHSTPGHIGPYVLSGEQLAGKFAPLQSASPNVPSMRAH